MLHICNSFLDALRIYWLRVCKDWSNVFALLRLAEVGRILMTDIGFYLQLLSLLILITFIPVCYYTFSKDIFWEWTDKLPSESEHARLVKDLAKVKALAIARLKARTNYLARLPPKVRRQIFEHYFAACRPEPIYRESQYNGIHTWHLLFVLKQLLDHTLYNEALQQYYKASHFLFHGPSIGEEVFRGFNFFRPGVFQSLTDVTLGPRYVTVFLLRSLLILTAPKRH
jgi:hypothetical protein